MFIKKKKLSTPKKKRVCTKDKIERVLKEVKQLSEEAEDFFDTVNGKLAKEEENG